jgi:DNA-binding HxlR family transcriptional regulator
MAPMRTYGDGCATARALDLIGERWGLLVIRELLFGPKRFTDLRAGLPGASPDVLAQRLRELEAAGVLRRRKLGPPVSTSVYELTEWGSELEPVLMALGRWGRRSPAAEDDLEMSVDSYALALKADFDPEAAGDLEARYQLQLGEQPFRVEVAEGSIDVARGETNEPDAVIESEPKAMADVLWRDSSLSEALRSGTIRIEGDPSLAKRFFDLYPAAAPAESN